MAASYPRNARIRIEGTRNLVAAAQAAGARRFIVQSIAFAYAPGREPHAEDRSARCWPTGLVPVTVRGAADMERKSWRPAWTASCCATACSTAPAPGTTAEAASRRSTSMLPPRRPLLALTRGAPGIYNIAEDDGAVSIEKARRELGFDPAFRSPI